MRALLVDRLGFERIADEAAGIRYHVPRKFVPGTSDFHRYGPVRRNGEEFMEYREADDMSEELKKEHDHVAYLRGEIRRLEGRVRSLEEENGGLALALHRRTA